MQLNTEKIDINQIPKDVEKILRLDFEGSPKTRQMRVQAQMAQRRGDYATALRINQMVEVMYSELVCNYLTDVVKENVKERLSEVGLPDKDLTAVMVYMLAAFMSIDILNSCIIDANDIIHKTNKDWHLEMFDDIRKIATLAKGKLRNLYVNTRYLDDDIWGDIVDNMYKMAYNKAQSIFNKMNKKYGVEIVKPIDYESKN